jgi:hypothetical protein
MPSRVQLKQTIYMILDNQPQIVLSGSVIDIPDSVTLSAVHFQALVETPNNVTKSTSVRNLRTR